MDRFCSGLTSGLERICVLCGDTARGGCDLCRRCRADLPALHCGCEQCALPLPTAGLCAQCQARPPPYHRVYTPFIYQPPLDYLIHGMKYNQRLGYARLLGVMLAEYLVDAAPGRPQLLIPVPLHGRRLRQRGYNQALEVARPVARSLGIGIDARCCRRTRVTAPQSRLGAEQRRRNLKGAFRVAHPPRVHHVALIDDVMTTGTTVAELARVLVHSGVTRVDVWVCARAALPV